MKKMISVVAAISMIALTVVVLGIAEAVEDRQIPTAPPSYLERINPVDVQTVDSKFLKKVGRLYRGKCRKCHGQQGDGKGPSAEFAIIQPAAFSAPGYLASRKDGQLFWIIENGSPGTEMPAHGPGSDIGLSEEAIWKLIAYLRYQFTFPRDD